MNHCSRNRFAILGWLAAVVAVVPGVVVSAADVAAAGKSAKPARPNIVLIISDDHAWTDYGFQGNADVRTPNIDRLAKEGLAFTRGYVTTALCSPSLATMLTGLHPHQHRITGNDPVKGESRELWFEQFFKNPMMPRQLADAGYLTMHTGKYWMRKPADAGFTDDMGDTDRHGGKALAIGRESMKPIYDFIDKARAQEKPFFVWYAPFLPHTPHNPPKRLLQKYEAIQDPAKAKYYAMIEWLDETCGDLMANLKTRGVDDDTMIVYVADNGWNTFGKGSPYENGVRTPIIVRWPGKVAPRMEKEHLASNIDVVPTILSAAGVAAPAGLPGVDLRDERAVAGRDAIFLANYAHDMASAAQPEKSLWTRSCIQGGWKLLAWREHPPTIKPPLGGDRHKDPDALLELYDLAADPHETVNLAAKHPDRVRDMQRRLDAWWTPSERSGLLKK